MRLFDVDEVPTGSSKSNEWYTPSRYIEAARAVMQGIDLDPASCEEANRTVKAARYYSLRDDGLSKPWLASSVWLNPPFGRKDAAANGFGGGKTIMGIFIKKLIGEYHNGNVKQAILLATPKTDASWFWPLWEFPICIADHRVIFYRPGLEPQGHFFGTIFVYLGPDIALFTEVFTEFGMVITPDGVHRRPAPVQQPTLWDSQEEAS